MATKNSSIILSRITDEIFDKSKINRIRLSARRIINEYQINRVYKDGKDSSGNKFKDPSPKWAKQKAKILSGDMKGRGGKGASKTIRNFKRIVSSLNTPYTARSVNDKMRFTGRLLTTFDVPLDSIRIVRQRNNRYRLDFSTSATGKNNRPIPEVEQQLKGLKRNGYEPLGFKTVPGDLRIKLENAIIRILNS